MKMLEAEKQFKNGYKLFDYRESKITLTKDLVYLTSIISESILKDKIQSELLGNDSPLFETKFPNLYQTSSPDSNLGEHIHDKNWI